MEWLSSLEMESVTQYQMNDEAVFHLTFEKCKNPYLLRAAMDKYLGRLDSLA